MGVRMPLLEIDLDHIIPDELHMLLRVTDVLIQNLIHAATSHDKNISNVAITVESKNLYYIATGHACMLSGGCTFAHAASYSVCNFN